MVVPGKHVHGFVAGKFHNNRSIYAGLSHIGVEGVAEVMEPHILYACPSSGAFEGSLDTLYLLAVSRKDEIVGQGPYPSGLAKDAPQRFVEAEKAPLICLGLLRSQVDCSSLHVHPVPSKA